MKPFFCLFTFNKEMRENNPLYKQRW